MVTRQNAQNTSPSCSKYKTDIQMDEAQRDTLARKRVNKFTRMILEQVLQQVSSLKPCIKPNCLPIFGIHLAIPMPFLFRRYRGFDTVYKQPDTLSAETETNPCLNKVLNVIC